MQDRQGLRCQICTGCGRCPGVQRVSHEKGGIHVLTREGSETAAVNLRNEKNFRLIAVDVGTTTIAMELYDENGNVADTHVLVNPQVKYGSDVISRITAAEDGQVKNELRDLVKSALTQGVKRFLKCMNEGELPFLVIAANTTMSYLFMGWDTAELGVAPFHASRLSGAFFYLEGDEVPKCPCVLLPGISTFVGADVFAGIISCSMADHDEVTLLVDLGTNGEMAIGNRKGILATATAAGPAFEGGAGRGIWGADMVHFSATLLREGILDETGLLKEPYFRSGIRIGNVMITKETVRGLQLAKAATLAGIRILCREYGADAANIDRVVLAGGFGYYLRPEDAVCIGMLPKNLENKTVSGGNTALSGAKMMGAAILQNISKWDEMIGLDGVIKWEKLRNMPCHVKTLNLAMHPAFAEEYVGAMRLGEFMT